MGIQSRLRRIVALCVAGGTVATALLMPGAAGAQEGVGASAAAGADSSTDTLDLTLERAERLVRTGNPGLRAARRSEDIAVGELRQARTYRYNPRVELEARTLDPEPGAGVLDRYEAVISQEIEWAGQWGLRRDAAESGVREAAASVADAERRMLLEVRWAFYEVVAARRKAEVAAKVSDLATRLLEAVRTELELGEVGLLDANLAEIEFGRGRARILGARRELESALLRLKTAAGISPETVVRMPGDPGVAGPGAESPESEMLPDPGTLSVDSLTRVALGRRPDLLRAEAAVTRADQLERLARREAIPNLRLVAPIERGGVEGSADIGLGVGLSVPIWNRNQGTSDARRAELEQARYRHEEVTLSVRAEVRDALQAYRSASEAAFVLESSVLGPAESNLQLVEESYEAGKIDLTDLLFLQNQLLDAHTEYWDAWQDRHRAWARLRAAVGDDNSMRVGDQP